MATYGGGQRILDGGTILNVSSPSATLLVSDANGYSVASGILAAESSTTTILTVDGFDVAFVNNTGIGGQLIIHFNVVVPSGSTLAFTRTGVTASSGVTLSYVRFTRA